jgi:hypothetical protein
MGAARSEPVDGSDATLTLWRVQEPAQEHQVRSAYPLVDFSPAAEFEHHDQDPRVFDGVDDPVVTGSDPEEPVVSREFLGTGRSGIIRQTIDPWSYPRPYLPIELP